MRYTSATAPAATPTDSTTAATRTTSAERDDAAVVRCPGVASVAAGLRVVRPPGAAAGADPRDAADAEFEGVAVVGGLPRCHDAGGMLCSYWKTLWGSYFALISRSRSKLAPQYAVSQSCIPMFGTLT
ncbi:hypothetical protein M2271_007631 [Streptomyces sp. LBL]|nr:hypothetical protein [Streptomyces sp. LBL]